MYEAEAKGLAPALSRAFPFPIWALGLGGADSSEAEAQNSSNSMEKSGVTERESQGESALVH